MKIKQRKEDKEKKEMGSRKGNGRRERKRELEE